MRLTHLRRTRRGATLVVVAIVLPLMLLLMLAAIDTSSAVYRYQQVATLAREGARYASVHAGQYSQERGLPVATVDEVKTNAVLPRAVNLQSSQVACTLVWVNGSSSPYSVTGDSGQRKANIVRFTISYPWTSLFMFGGSMNLTSTSEAPISY